MMRKVYAPMALALITAFSHAQETAEESVYKDPRFIAAHDGGFNYKYEWFDDGEILLGGEWETGMHVKRINYCIDEESHRFISMQVEVGNDEKELSLRKHGGDGGKCRAF